ncbi:hypothetical protein IP92_04914 [Pseudoduganella flava]|uniref:Uncharacterized protein n=1 Tax=Pseudoduganella flava TaxID=871742 RepID=A0A562PG91_9BURK|nr:hypothetical protein [Pseudoduganella flava]QGZ40177.1 hypothetical protein GO485_14730 [Pseudoduganella flava]TWI43353.1 hypothetical protein IP92_04914 [Pseudoduganella flava]
MGALRLSLHLAAELGLVIPAICDGERVIVVHHAERHELWAAGRERPAWDRLATVEEEAPGWLDRYLHSAASSTDVHSYWRIEERAGTLDVPATNWKTLAAAIGADLAISVSTQNARAEPFRTPRRSDTWEALPLFPATESGAPAHRLLGTLVDEQAALADERNPKNENSAYQNLGAQAAAESDNWGARLDGWVVEVLLRCANESRGTPDTLDDQLLARLTPEPAQRSVAATGPVAAAAGTGEPAPLPKWARRLGLVLTAAGLTVLLLASAHILARYPWVALAFGSMMTLYLWRKK